MENLLATPDVTFQPPVNASGAPPGLDHQASASAPSAASGAPSAPCTPSCNSAPAPAKLVGIARLAQSSPRVRERTGVEYFSLPARSALNRESSGRMPFSWTLNPYRGCEFGCKYCYARYTHEFMELHDGLEFERKIFAKLGSPALLRDELRRARDRGLPIALGTATDPYQPAEKQFGVTRGMLQVFGEFEGLDFSITTKSPLILRDLDLLVPLAARHRLSVHITVTTVDARLARLLEPKAPPPSKRLEAVRQLTRAGIRTGVNAAPILPGLTDSPAQLDRLARAASEHGARFLLPMILFLMPSAMAQFMPFLEKQRPQLVRRYRKLFRHSAYLSQDYKDGISKLVAELRARYGLDSNREENAVAPLHRQYSLAFA
jgi:DNA repair photolyase